MKYSMSLIMLHCFPRAVWVSMRLLAYALILVDLLGEMYFVSIVTHRIHVCYIW